MKSITAATTAPQKVHSQVHFQLQVMWPGCLTISIDGNNRFRATSAACRYCTNNRMAKSSIDMCYALH